MHVSTTFTNGAQRELQLLTVSQGPINKTVGFPEDSKITTTSAAVHSSPSTGELRRNGTSKNPADELIEQSTENEFDLTSLHKQNDSPSKYSVFTWSVRAFLNSWIFLRAFKKTFGIFREVSSLMITPPLFDKSHYHIDFHPCETVKLTEEVWSLLLCEEMKAQRV